MFVETLFFVRKHVLTEKKEMSDNNSYSSMQSGPPRLFTPLFAIDYLSLQFLTVRGVYMSGQCTTVGLGLSR